MFIRGKSVNLVLVVVGGVKELPTVQLCKKWYQMMLIQSINQVCYDI